MCVVDVCHRIRESHPGVSPLHFLITCWEAMAYRYVSDVMNGVRRLMRILPDNVRKTEYRRKALTPGPNGATSEGFPNYLADEPPFRVLGGRFPFRKWREGPPYRRGM